MKLPLIHGNMFQWRSYIDINTLNQSHCLYHCSTGFATNNSRLFSTNENMTSNSQSIRFSEGDVIYLIRRFTEMELSSYTMRKFYCLFNELRLLITDFIIILLFSSLNQLWDWVICKIKPTTIGFVFVRKKNILISSTSTDNSLHDHHNSSY